MADRDIYAIVIDTNMIPGHHIYELLQLLHMKPTGEIKYNSQNDQTTHIVVKIGKTRGSTKYNQNKLPPILLAILSIYTDLFTECA